MLKNISQHQRILRLGLFILAFIVLAPILLLYAQGYIFDQGWSFLETGGVYLESVRVDSQVYINGKLEGTTNFFQRDFFLKNLKPGRYLVEVKKNGYNTWQEIFTVEPNLVAVARVFVLPEKVPFHSVSEFLPVPNNQASSTKPVVLSVNPEYDSLKNIFAKKEPIKLNPDFSLVAKASTSLLIRKNVSLWFENNDIYLGWLGSQSQIPKNFWNDGKYLNQEKVYTTGAEIKKIDFYPGESDIVLVGFENKLYAVEGWFNDLKKLQLLYATSTAIDFRVVDNEFVYIKAGKNIIELDL